MEDRIGSDAIPHPRWESFQIESNEPGTDFPAGPYNRMIAKLYGTGDEPMQYIDISRPENTSSRLGLANGQPVLPVSEGRMDRTPVRSFSGGQLMHKTRQEDEPSRFGPAVAQYTEGSRQDDQMATKLHGTFNKALEYIDISRKDSTSSRFGLSDGQPVPPLSEGTMDKTPVRSFAGGQLMPRTRQEDELSRFGPAVAQHTEESKQGDMMIAKLSGTGGKPLENIDISRMDNTSSRLGLADGQPMPPVSEGMMDTTPVRSLAGSQLMHKTNQEDELSRFGPAAAQHTVGSRQDNTMVEKLYGTVSKPLEYTDITRMDNTSSRLVSADGRTMPPVSEGRMDKTPVRSFSGGQFMQQKEEGPSRFGPAVTQHTEGSKQGSEPVRFGPAEPKHLAEKEKLDNELVQSGTGDDHPAVKVSATMASAGGQSKDLADKVKLDGAPAGVIFLCNNKTKHICFQYGLFGMPGMQLKLVERIVPGTMLFLFVLESRELHGIFVASSNGGFNLEPNAFGPSFPSQVRFQISRLCRPLMEKDFKKAIEDNYYQYNKFKNELSAQQVSDLLQLFCPEVFVDKKEQKHENLVPSHTHAHGKKDFPVSGPAESQSELSMEISSQDPQSSPAVDSHQSSHRMLFMESHMGAQPSVMAASRDYNTSFKDFPAVSGQDPMGDQIRMWGLRSIPIEGSVPNHTHAHGKKDFPVSDPAESQSELSMEISSQDPQSSPAVDSHQSSHRMLFMESHMGAQPSVMAASRDHNTAFKDFPAVSGQDPMGDQIRMRGFRSIPIEGSMHYYSPSVDAPLLSKSSYMDVMGGSQKSFTEETSLVQPSLDRFQRDSTAFLREASGEIHQPMVDVRSRALGKIPSEGGHDIYADERHYLSGSRVASGSYSLDATDNDRKGSFYGPGLQPHGSGAQCHILNEQAEEKGNFHVKYNLQDSMHQSYAPNTSLHPYDGGVLGQRFSDADVERGKFLSQDSMHQSYAPNTSLHSYDGGVSGQRFSDADVERGKFLSQDSMHQSYGPNTSLHSYDGGVSGQRFSDADVDRGKFLSHDYLEASDHHISRSQLWSRAEVSGSSTEQNRFSQLNPNEREHYTNESEGLRQEHTERLARIRHMYNQDQQRSQENIEFNDSRDLSGGWADASNFNSHKRVFEDPVDYASNPVKRQHYYNESHGDKMAEVSGSSTEQNRFSQLNPDEREHYTNESEGLRQEQTEHLARIRHMYNQDQQRSQENIEFNDSRDLSGGWADASNFNSHKRVFEDPVDYASNPVKRQHYYNESHGDRMPDERARSVNGASLGGNWMGNEAMPRGQETTWINHKLNP